MVGFRLTRWLPRYRLALPKEYWAHGAVLLIVGVVVAVNALSTSADRGSLLFALFSEAEVEEGLVHRQNGEDNRGLLLGLVHQAAAGGISEDDVEFELANTLGGNALVATGAPETAEASAAARRDRVVGYVVRDGDTPGSIAARFGISTNTVLWANGIRDGDLIRPGDILVVLPTSGTLHTVVAGDDVTHVAERYDAKAEDVIRENGLPADGAIRVGQKLVIPDGQILAPRRVARYRADGPGGEDGPAPRSAPVPGTGLFWPITSRAISQYFGWRHPGIDVPNHSRSAVRAAQDGTVEFSGWLGGYGRLVVLNHGSGRRTYYAHLSATEVKSGARVSRGESVGRVGSTGRSTGPHLHFEVREGGRAVNPLRYF